jgi:hypothetical protein
MQNIYAQLKIAGIRLNTKGHIHKDDIEKAEPILRKYLEAMPMNVGKTDFGLKDPAKNLKMYRNLEKRKGVLLKDFDDYKLFEYPTYVALLQTDSKHVSYVVQFETKTVLGKKAVTQILLWRERPNSFIANLNVDGMKLTAYVFFKVLLAKHDCIVTDSMQTSMGEEFWKDRIADAWIYGYQVYYINQVTQDKILITSDNFDAVNSTYNIWGDEEISKAKKIAICKNQLWKPTQNID